MVDGITSTDNSKKSSFADFKVYSETSTVPVKTNPMPNDEVVIKEEQNKKKFLDKLKTANTLQVAAMVTGTLASAAIVIYFGKGLFAVNKNRKLAKQIKENFLPDNVKKQVELEFSKVKNGIDEDLSRNYIEHILRIPWTKTEPKIIDTAKAKEILDNEIIGLDGVKNGILTHIEVQNDKLEKGIKDKAPLVLCLNGPPGTGKTSIAKVIAKAMDRPFGRISLGGESYASSIIGTERVFKGSSPGDIIKILQNSGQSNPVILIDEIDKAGFSREHGSPLNALLDVLEPQQCKSFTDKYVELPYDLSDVTFIITSNEKSEIPATLLDRIKIFDVKEFSSNMKTKICNANIIKMMQEYKIDDSKVDFRKDGVDAIVNSTNDKGARKTIEQLKTVFDNIIVKIRKNSKEQKVIVDKNFVREALKKETM